MFRSILFLLLIAFSIEGRSQEIITKADFLTDSVKIGVPIGFSIMAKYPSDLDLLFPDSTFNFSPFELHEKLWFPTRSENGTSYDSVIYYLKTFETDSIQAYQLPFFRFQNGDSLRLLTESDSFALIHTVRSTPDSLSVIYLLEDTEYYRIPTNFNYPFALAFTSLGILLLLLGWLLFGARIQRILKARRLRKGYESYVQMYEDLQASLTLDKLPHLSEDILVHWKQYMESLEEIPYLKLTTKEVSILKNEKELIDSLRGMDKAIYSGAKLDEVVLNLTSLKTYSDKKFEEKLEEITHGATN